MATWFGSSLLRVLGTSSGLPPLPATISYYITLSSALPLYLPSSLPTGCLPSSIILSASFSVCLSVFIFNRWYVHFFLYCLQIYGIFRSGLFISLEVLSIVHSILFFFFSCLVQCSTMLLLVPFCGVGIRAPQNRV